MELTCGPVADLEQHPVPRGVEGHVPRMIAGNRSRRGSPRCGRRPPVWVPSGNLDGIDAVHRAGAQQLVPHRPLQNDAARLQVDGTCPAISPRNALACAAVSPSWWAANAIRSPRRRGWCYVACSCSPGWQGSRHVAGERVALAARRGRPVPLECAELPDNREPDRDAQRRSRR